MNRPSHRLAQLCQLFASALVLSAASASADAVLVLPASGDGPAEAQAAITRAVADAAASLAHQVSTEPAGDAIPQTANELRAIGELRSAEWVVVPIVHDFGEQSYWTTLRVGYVPAARVEELDAEVWRAAEGPRLTALLRAMLRPEGLSEDGFQLAGEDTEGRRLEADAARIAEEEARRAAEEAAAERRRQEAEAEEARRRAEEEAEAARLAAEEERRRAEEAAARAYEERDRYGVADGLMMVQVGGGFRSLVSTGDQRSQGGTLGTVELTFGRGFSGLPGLELRGGVDVIYGAASAFTLRIGAAYLVSPFRFPLHFGAEVQGGLFASLSGDRGAGALIGASALVAYNPVGRLYLELSVPGFQWISTGGGAVALGASLRAGLRF
ncbi:MAG: hypothetical protein AAF411_29290 [Myxococcota bacterium]